MFNHFIPDHMTRDVFEISPDLFVREGIRALILDIDNTLVPYTSPHPTEEILTWLAALTTKGIKYAFISNNDWGRVELFNRDIGAFAVAKSGKPSRKGLFAALKNFGLPPSEVACIGDQVFTDVWAARRAGLRVFLVDPIEPREDLFFKLKRLGEKPFRRMYTRRELKNNGK